MSDRPRSLDFLENLEIVEGRKLYYEKYAMYVVGNYHMTSLGLKSLRKVQRGAIGFKDNRNLCYGRGIPFKQKYQVMDAMWKENMPDRECGEFFGEIIEGY